jgi:hypothetical protein
MPRGNQPADSYGFRDITRDEANGVALNHVTQREALTRLA